MGSEKHFEDVREFGNRGASRGALVGIQPKMEPKDYLSAQAFESKLDCYLEDLKNRGLLKPKSVVVFPEYVATWLILIDEPKRVAFAKSTESAIAQLLMGNFWAFLKFAIASKSESRLKYGIFRAKAEKALDVYVSSFSNLSKKYEVTIVAGSLILPELSWKTENEIALKDRNSAGPLFNTTLVFHPDGAVDKNFVYKVFPTPQELPFTTPGNLDDLPVFETGLGVLGVLNCADSWYAETYKILEKKGAEYLAIPSFVEKDGDLGLPWNGKNITPAPPEFDSRDFFQITYDDAWIKYASPARLPKTPFKNSMNVFLRGRFWSMGSDGAAIIMADGKLQRGTSCSHATAYALWV